MKSFCSNFSTDVTMQSLSVPIWSAQMPQEELWIWEELSNFQFLNKFWFLKLSCLDRKQFQTYSRS